MPSMTNRQTVRAASALNVTAVTLGWPTADS